MSDKPYNDEIEEYINESENSYNISLSSNEDANNPGLEVKTFSQMISKCLGKTKDRNKTFKLMIE